MYTKGILSDCTLTGTLCSPDHLQRLATAHDSERANDRTRTTTNNEGTMGRTTGDDGDSDDDDESCLKRKILFLNWGGGWCGVGVWGDLALKSSRVESTVTFDD